MTPIIDLLQEFGSEMLSKHYVDEDIIIINSRLYRLLSSELSDRYPQFRRGIGEIRIFGPAGAIIVREHL